MSTTIREAAAGSRWSTKQDSTGKRLAMDMLEESARGEKIMAAATTPSRPPFPPLTCESAMQKLRLAEYALNTCDPAKVALGYAIDSRWRNRREFINGPNEITDFLSRKWAWDLDYGLIEEMWAFTRTRIAVRFAYEWHDDSGHWYRSYRNENWKFNSDGSWRRDLHPSMTFPFWLQIGNITGCSGVVPITTRG
jgi:nuclear transport factor 2 (NTF2) superfamily protein